VGIPHSRKWPKQWVCHQQLLTPKEKLAKKLERDLSEFFEFTGLEPIFNKFQNPKEVPMEETQRLYKLIDYLQSEVERLSNENKELRTFENPLPGREASTQ
jgi:hypothetical protein